MHHHYPTQSSDEKGIISRGSEGSLSSAASEPSAYHTCCNSYIIFGDSEGIYYIYLDSKASYSPDEIYSLDSVTDNYVAMAKDLDELFHS
jgi:hypothetical protein